MIDAFLLIVRLTGFDNVDDAFIGEQQPGDDEAVGAKQAADRLLVAGVVVFLQALADPAQQMIGNHAEEHEAVDFGLQKCHVELPESCGSKALVGLQKIVAGPTAR